ncbi:hypothetical protein ES1_12600 [[Eubacterium] siraeum V10Sc8a]|uniref:Uncharacterized protein n=1 Tax=[Eubacterium] siraeum V10Sc8a TaxID=717961 RepID=D4MKH7_9FIRM|nr:hypothetical protein ES1_12600 [[Eubacterium] siraeum V10Sc8a]
MISKAAKKRKSKIIFLFFGFIKQNTTVSPYLLFLTISFLCCKIYVECGSNRFPLFFTVTA